MQLARYLLMDLDDAHGTSVFAAIDIRIIKTPVEAPRQNAIAERFVGTIRGELL
jgi:hypothetical protein